METNLFIWHTEAIQVKIFFLPFQRQIDYVIHFAVKDAVGESMKVILLYYQNNLIGTINLLEVQSRFLHMTVYLQG